MTIVFTNKLVVRQMASIGMFKSFTSREVKGIDPVHKHFINIMLSCFFSDESFKNGL